MNRTILTLSWIMAVQLALAPSELALSDSRTINEARPVFVNPRTIRVPEDYFTIQEAIDDATNGDIIKVSSGIYYESVGVKKPVSLIGEDKATTIIDGNYTATELLTVSDAYVSGFTIRRCLGTAVFLGHDSTFIGNNVRDNGMAGIRFGYGPNIVVAGNELKNNKYGIFIGNPSTNITVLGNNIINNTWSGIYLTGTEPLPGQSKRTQDLETVNSTFIGNNVEGNRWGGIIGSRIRNNVFIGNTIRNNGDVSITSEGGIYLSHSSNISLVGNNVYSNTRNGITLWPFSHNFSLVENNVYNNNGHGISFSVSDYMTLYGNNVWNNNGDGISCGSNNTYLNRNNIIDNKAGVTLRSSLITMWENNIRNNGKYGLKIWGSNISIFHNNFANAPNVEIEDQAQNISFDEGYPSGGNFWHNYGGVDLYRGLGQNETGVDGIGDTPHMISNTYKDYYPLTQPRTISVIPVAHFEYLPEDRPLIGETITFNASESVAHNGGIRSYQWSFGDGNITITEGPFITHAFETYGTYVVTLTVTNAVGLNNTTTKAITVHKMKSNLSIHIAQDSASIGSNVTITGYVSLLPDNANVRIFYRLLPDAWALLGESTIASNGRFSYAWSPAKPGVYEIKGYRSGDERILSAESTVMTITIEESLPEFVLYVLIGIGATVIAAVATLSMKTRKRLREKRSTR